MVGLRPPHVSLLGPPDPSWEPCEWEPGSILGWPGCLGIRAVTPAWAPATYRCCPVPATTTCPRPGPSWWWAVPFLLSRPPSVRPRRGGRSRSFSRLRAPRPARLHHVPRPVGHVGSSRPCQGHRVCVWWRPHVQTEVSLLLLRFGPEEDHPSGGECPVGPTLACLPKVDRKCPAQPASCSVALGISLGPRCWPSK